MSGAAFFDTSVLLGGLIDLGPSSAPAQRLMTAVATGQLRRVHTAWHCCLEFYAVSTRLPEELRLHPRDAWRLIDAISCVPEPVRSRIVTFIGAHPKFTFAQLNSAS